MKKSKLFYLCALFALILVIVACTDNVQEQETINIGTLMGPTGMGMALLMENNDTGKSNLDYEFTVVASPDELVGKIVNKEIDIAAVPSNLAATLYNVTNKQVEVLAINTLGVLYMLEEGHNITSINDLKGKDIHISGKGTVPEYVFKYLLEKNQINPESDLSITFSTHHADLSTKMAAGDVELSILPQPHVTTVLKNNPNVRIAMDVNKEWKQEFEQELPMGVVVAQKDFIKENTEELELFFNEYKSSVNFVNSNQSEAGEFIQNFGILPNAQIATEAIELSNIVFIDMQKGKQMLDSLYQILFEYNPQSVGGQLPDEDFYYEH